MAKRTYGQDGGKVVDLSALPKGMRRADPECDVVTIKDRSHLNPFKWGRR